VVLLSKLEETLIVDGQRIELSANRYPGVVRPDGHRFLRQFRLDPFPTFTYVVSGVEIEKTVFMIHGENATVVQYRLRGAGVIRLELRPLIAFRDYHHLTHENRAINPHVDIDGTSVRLQPYPGLPTLHLEHGGAQVAATGHWYRHFEYDQERRRGLDYVEDLFNPCVITVDVRTSPEITIVASTDAVTSEHATEPSRAERNRRQSIFRIFRGSDDVTRTLFAAADQFIVARATGKSVIAGYHWFTDWGRDTMIALPGLTLTTRRPSIAREILAEFARHIDHGMIPTRFPDGGEAPEYAGADVTLWFFYAVQMYLRHTRDYAFVRSMLYDALVDSLAWHVRGTRFQIRADRDGLLNVGPADRPLTWMDVRIGDRMITPRFGKPVEVQALWYNALRFMEALAKRYGDADRRREYATLASRAKRSFTSQFWNADAGCLYDVVREESRDGSVRPNQVLAVSVPYTMLPRAEAIAVLDVVERLLLTPYGLRTLAASDPRYCGRYDGDAQQRDAAYHQGTVWPWLIGPFVTAYCRTHRGPSARAKVEGWLKPLVNHLSEAGLGQVSEVFDGDPPHRPGGCIAQAWSVAELLRAGRTA
jgi:predicted glycogen debranching enzyme